MLDKLCDRCEAIVYWYMSARDWRDRVGAEAVKESEGEPNDFERVLGRYNSAKDAFSGWIEKECECQRDGEENE